MKNIVIAILLSVSASTSFAAKKPEQVVLCGTFNIASSRGMLPATVPYLDVVDESSRSSVRYEILAAGRTFSEAQKRSELLNSLVRGEEYCIRGFVEKKTAEWLILLPNEIVELE